MRGPHCEYINTNLYFYSYWWLLIFIQVLLFFPFVFSLSWLGGCLCRCKPVDYQWWNYMLLYFQATFWCWMTYLFICADCGMYAGRPLICVGIVSAIILYLCNITSFFGSEDKAMWNKITMETFNNYWEAALRHPPQVQFSGEAFHSDHRTEGHGRNRKTKSVRVSTYNGAEEFRYGAWVDHSEHHDMEPVRENDRVMINFTFEQSPGDPYTGGAVEKVKQNYKIFVSQLDQFSTDIDEKIAAIEVNDGQIRGKLVHGNDQVYNQDVEKQIQVEKTAEIFSMITRQRKKYQEKKNGKEKDGKHYSCLVVSDNDAVLPCYMNKVLMVILNLLVISAPLKMLISFSTKKRNFTLRKLFYCDPSQTQPSFHDPRGRVSSRRTGEDDPLLGHDGNILVSRFSEISRQANCHLVGVAKAAVTPTVQHLPVGVTAPTAYQPYTVPYVTPGTPAHPGVGAPSPYPPPPMGGAPADPSAPPLYAPPPASNPNYP